MSLHTNPNDPVSPSNSAVLKDRPATKQRRAEKPASEGPKVIDGRPPANSPETWKLGLDWPVVVWIGVVHLFAIAAPFFFTWQALATCVVLILATGSLGVCMGYHRLLTHGSFKTYKPIRWLLALLGGLSGEGSAIMWVSNHRKHHKYSDHDGDPHSPRDGAWWSHMLWFMPNWGQKISDDIAKRYAGDLLKDPMMRFLHKMFLPSHFILGVGLFLMGYFGAFGLTGGWWDGMSMLLWGTGVRMVYVMHVTWFVNSVTHMWGYRNYDTTDDSTNLWWVGLLAFGEGWHNNHHAYQRVASQGHKWWEIDVTYWVIWMMEKTGLAWDVIRLKDVKHTKPA
ncbi:fatty acid desaturase [Aeoliella sp. ICT_H6.2]|uniref:Fatty acid desaturase n=1 Tax=Aeoliella straminimaris TaxID=2954799 RepID=A0A9X2FJQ3_9BACT|nr:fatty acid desaturase [Aeoliella straminimaris]MCO6047671.1 fatty acid desaturase [Aeoliella straminimaris]